ncbi:uncharacterized protein LOC111899957 [Lactuca sativa]|uniref:uncharacterized protein LOC111899957 n=1 Tax=Lactuca sativa TaxID=4236 RepID=UPI000CD8A122|nr:uncharacterized protein LOC111899957 [Lactuca sativa]
MIFKVDFDKAYDSVSWEYLLKIMEFMDFDQKWIRWIQACLESSRAAILVNGSPTKEFSLNRGLCQDDPLSPFLFIMVMEGLNIAMEDATSQGLFKGLEVGDPGYNIYHIFYVDDAIFLGVWNKDNIENLITILNCFYLISGLRINLQKPNYPLSYLLWLWKGLIRSVLGSLTIYYFSLFKVPSAAIRILENLRACFF